MKTPSVSLLLGVSVLLLLLSGLTVSAVSLNVSPNLQQFFTRAAPVSLRCVGQTVDGWTVKRTSGGQTEQCGAAGSDFGRIDGSSCVFDLSTTSTTVYWCETSSGQSSDQVTITVTDKDLILEIPALPVVTGSDVTLHCIRRNSGNTVEAYFFIDGREDTVRCVDFNVRNIQQSDEGLYSCGTNDYGKSPKSRLRVRDPPTISDPPTTTSSTSSGPHITTTVFTATTFNNTHATVSSSSSLFFSVIRLFVHVVVFCPYCICTVLMVSICCSRKTGNKPVVSMEMTQDDEEYDDITGVSTKPELRAAQ